MATAPASTISNEHTVANTGLRVKKLTMRDVLESPRMGLATAAENNSKNCLSDQRLSVLICGRLLRLGHHRHAVGQHLHVAYNDPVAGLDAVQHHVVVSYQVAHLDHTLARHRALPLSLSHESEELSAEPRHRGKGNHRRLPL